MTCHNDPKRWSASGASDLERRLIGAIARERPSPEERNRMAAVIGVSVAGVGAGVGAGAAMAAATGAKGAAAAGSGSSALLPWISAGMLGLTLVAAFVGVRAWKSPAPPDRQTSATEIASPLVPALGTSVALPEVSAPSPVEPSRSVAALTPQRRNPSGSSDNELGAQIALIDSARAAVSASAGERALGILRQYQVKYPAGTFRSEAAALRIEALAKMGRTSEARALAQRFVQQYGESPQADRVSRIAGLRP